MATVKAVSSGASIGRAIDYVKNKEKTEEKLLDGFDCSPDMVKEEMQATKELWGKTDGRTYMHFVQSWHEDEPITNATAHQIGMKLAQALRAEGKPWNGFEVLVATHTDRAHTHNHLIVNSVNAENGKKLQFSPQDLAAMKEISDQLCLKYGLSICKKGKSFHGEDLTMEQPSTYTKEAHYIMEQAAAGNIDSYIKEIAKAVTEVKSTAISREDFCQQLEERGIAVNWSDTRKNITYIDVAREMHGERKCKVRDSNLEKTFPNLQFSKESLILAFTENQQKALDQAAPEVENHVAAVEANVDQQPAEGRQKAVEEPEKGKDIPAAPVAQKPSEKLRAAFDDLKAAQAKLSSAQYAYEKANRLPFYDKRKKEKREDAGRELSAALQACREAFDRVVSFGISTYRDGVQLSATALDLDDMKSLSKSVEWKAKELERSEAHDAKRLTHEEVRSKMQQQRAKEKEAEPEIIVRFGKTKSKGHEDR